MKKLWDRLECAVDARESHLHQAEVERVKRNRLIRRLRHGGASVMDLAGATGIRRAQVYRIIDEHQLDA